MDLDGIHRRQKDPSTPLSYRYPENSLPKAQLSSRKLSFDPFAQNLSTPNFVANTVSAATIPVFDHYGVSPSTQASQAVPMYEPWNLPQRFQQVHDPSIIYNSLSDPTAHTMTQDDSIGYHGDVGLAGIPRSFERYNFPMNEYSTMSTQNLEPGAYMTDLDTSNEFGYQKRRNVTPYLLLDDVGNIDRPSMSGSPKMELDFNCTDELTLTGVSLAEMPSKQATDDGKPDDREMTGTEINDGSVEEPYAKLIYRALMSAPNHSMVLQEIYQWFRNNTTKGSSDTKGWMNSIRHNLSMNAAFKKTERKLSGDEGKKSTEWVLEDFAIKDGVQSTTRYRKGTASKVFMRSDAPARNRQLSSRRGTISSSRNLRQRRDHRLEPRLRPQHSDAAQRSHLPHQALSQLSQRQRSPFTPPNPDVVDTSLSCESKGEHFEMQYDASYGFEDVQGVLIEDSALFTSGLELGFYGCHGLPTHDLRP